MAFAITGPPAAGVARTSSQTRAAGLTSLAVVIAAFATMPLVILLAKPVSGLVSVRGTERAADGSAGLVLTLLLVAPAAYALFFGTAGELLKGRVPDRVHVNTMRVAAIGLVPYLVMMVSAVFWKSGPQDSMMVAGGLTILVGIAATIWASTRQH